MRGYDADMSINGSSDPLGPAELFIDLTETGTGVRVIVTGEIDMSTADGLRDSLMDATRRAGVVARQLARVGRVREPPRVAGPVPALLVDGADGRQRPLGVVAGIAPFNFPAMVPMWMFPLALACGNTFVLKPSEKVANTSQLLVELLQKINLPAGVVNMVHGGKQQVDGIVNHKDIKAISKRLQ